MKITDVKSLPVWAGRRNLLVFCQMMPPHTLDFLEESIRDETPGAYETLRTMTDVPLANRGGVLQQVGFRALRGAGSDRPLPSGHL